MSGALSFSRRVSWYRPAMRKHFQIGPLELALAACLATLAVLVYAEGWIWPLKAAALMIPVTLLIG